MHFWISSFKKTIFNTKLYTSYVHTLCQVVLHPCSFCNWIISEFYMPSGAWFSDHTGAKVFFRKWILNVECLIKRESKILWWNKILFWILFYKLNLEFLLWIFFIFGDGKMFHNNLSNMCVCIECQRSSDDKLHFIRKIVVCFVCVLLYCGICYCWNEYWTIMIRNTGYWLN